MGPTTPQTLKKKLLCFTFGCGCRDAKSVSVSTTTTTTTTTTAATTTTTTSKLQHEASSAITSSTSSDEQRAASTPPSNSMNEETDTSPTFSGLLQQLSELEEGVLSLKGNCQLVDKAKGGVAVVTESDDPVGDFRVSMMQMMVEEEIATADEVVELVGRFLALNSPEHHPFILRAFAQIWQQVLSHSQIAPGFQPPN